MIVYEYKEEEYVSFWYLLPNVEINSYLYKFRIVNNEADPTLIFPSALPRNLKEIGKITTAPSCIVKHLIHIAFTYKQNSIGFGILVSLLR